MDVRLLADVISTIKAGFEAIDVWQRYGSAKDAIQTLDLEYNPSEFIETAKKLAPSIDPEYDQVFSDARGRVKHCLDQFRAAIIDNQQLPGDREKFGKAARSCVCRELALILDFMAGELPEELKTIWERHKCAELRKPMYAQM